MATNQGVVGSNPASRARISVLDQRVRRFGVWPVFFGLYDRGGSVLFGAPSYVTPLAPFACGRRSRRMLGPEVKQLERLLFLQGQRCFFCQQAISPGEASVEHLIATSNGGTKDDENCVAQTRCGVGEDPNDAGAPLDLLG